jgi:PKHD-type hydroxylase
MIPNRNNPHNAFTRDEIATGFRKILTLENVLSKEQCETLMQYGEENVVPADNKHSKAFAIKVDHCFLPLDHEIHTHLQDAWIKANEFFNFDIEFIEPYELKKYPIGGFYSKHIDNYHGMSIPVDRKISMILQLSDEVDYAGGDVQLMFIKVPKKRGSMTFFPSFYPHEVQPVLRGTRWSMVSWAWGPYWK